MHNFKDATGRNWEIVVNVGAVKRVRTLCGVDVLAISDFVEDRDKDLRFLTDPVLLVDVLYVICKNECDARHVSDEEFGRALVGDAIAEASVALLEELIEFFPTEKRAILKKYWDASRRFEDAMAKKLEAELSDEAIDAMVKEHLNSLSTTPSAAPPSSE